MADSPTPRPDFDAWWDYEHPDATEARFREILPAALQLGDRDYLAQLLTQIARCQGLQMKFDEAGRTLDEAEALVARGMPVARTRLLLERGRLYNSSKRREEAKPLFRQAWETAAAAGADAYAVDAAHMLGIVETGDTAAPSSWPKRRRIRRRGGGSARSTTISAGPSTTRGTSPPRSISSGRR
jgi:tetratricopeptide (TPR) repeat protein